jgi:hypothetical protein
MRAYWLPVLAGAWMGLAPAAADQATLERTDAFDRAFAASFYQFDACGDGLAGRTYRKALNERFAQCPFSADARTRFRQRSAAQFRKSRDVMARLIEDNGGLPVRLEGMARTCREQIDSPEYQAVRHHLDDYVSGKLTAEAVVDGACEAEEILPR